MKLFKLAFGLKRENHSALCAQEKNRTRRFAGAQFYFFNVNRRIAEKTISFMTGEEPKILREQNRFLGA